MSKRIIIEMDVDYWNDGMRKALMQYLIHNLKVTDEDDKSEFKGIIFEPLKPYPLIPIDRTQEKIFDITWE